MYNSEQDPARNGGGGGGGSGGGVMARARQFNRLAEENQARGRSMERKSDAGQPQGGGVGGDAGLRGRAVASVRNEYAGTAARHDAPPAAARYAPGPAPAPAYNEPMPNGGGGGEQQQQPQQQVVTPELLVDALSGHEDGLLAIAERLMEHYDAGYDAMGECIIDAFSDKQKLFQHVVEAAHMEGAAFEASRREEEMARLREAAGEDGIGGIGVDGGTGAGGSLQDNDYGPRRQSPDKNSRDNNAGGGASRHDEFIDQDVRDVLNDAIRRSRPLREADNHAECYVLYETACNSASALLPVDSDHRGRLQLSIARAESMSADRACAILKYAMDDVLRSGLTAGVGGTSGGIDPSKRGDCVLAAPTSDGDPAVVQSADEALASLVEEMKEVLSAPVYENSPLQSVAARFWEALGDVQRSNVKTEEKLEQKLASLKAEYLLAREEWEDKLGSAKRENDALRLKYNRLLKDANEGWHQYMDDARGQMMANGDDRPYGNGASGSSHNRGFISRDHSFGGDRSTMSSVRGLRSSTASVASFGSGLAQQAKSIVGTLACTVPSGERRGVHDGTTSYRNGDIDGEVGRRSSRSRSRSRR